MSFDPNDFIDNLYSTYIPSRKPKFKIHENLGHAVNALKYRARYAEKSYREIPKENKLWKMVNGKWEELKFPKRYNCRTDYMLGLKNEKK